MPPIGTVWLKACEIVMAGIRRLSTRSKNGRLVVFSFGAALCAEDAPPPVVGSPFAPGILGIAPTEARVAAAAAVAALRPARR